MNRKVEYELQYFEQFDMRWADGENGEWLSCSSLSQDLKFIHSFKKDRESVHPKTIFRIIKRTTTDEIIEE